MIQCSNIDSIDDLLGLVNSFFIGKQGLKPICSYVIMTHIITLWIKKAWYANA